MRGLLTVAAHLQGESPTGEFFDRVTHEVSTAAMKYALLSVSCQARTKREATGEAYLGALLPASYFARAHFPGLYSRLL